MANWPVLSGSDDAAFPQQNLLQTLKLDSDGQIPATGVQQWKKGADVASAAALPLGNDGNYFDVTGAVTITSIVQTAVGGAAVQAGTVAKLHFDGACIITHHATQLILPGGINKTTAANDEAEFINSDGANHWRCTSYLAAYGPSTWTPVVTFGGASVGITYATQTGTYTKIGNREFFDCSIILTSKGSSVGQMKITGLLFTAANPLPVNIWLRYVTPANIFMGIVSTNTIELQELTEGGTISDLTDVDFANNSQIKVSGQCLVA